VYFELAFVKTGADDVSSLSNSKLIKRTSISRRLDAGIGWRQYADDVDLTLSTGNKVTGCFFRRLFVGLNYY